MKRWRHVGRRGGGEDYHSNSLFVQKNGKHRAMKQSGSLHIPITFGEKIIFPIKMYHSVFEHCLPLVLYSLDLFPQKRAISIYNYPQKGMMTQQHTLSYTQKTISTSFSSSPPSTSPLSSSSESSRSESITSSPGSKPAAFGSGLWPSSAYTGQSLMSAS